MYDEPCPTCHGCGRGPSARTIQARIPAGRQGRPADPAARARAAPGENGGPAGDLFVTVKVTPHRLFGRKGDNLTLDVPVSFDEAALGAEIKIPTLGGAPVTLKIPAGTPNGRTFRVRGSGATQEATAPRATCSPPCRCRCPRALDADRARGRRGLPRRHGRQPLRANLFEAVVMSHAQPLGPRARPDAAVYVISVAAELTGLHPQTLRAYERMGLITPGRTGGGGRRYSHRDIELLREIAELTARRHRHRGRTPDPRARAPGRRARAAQRGAAAERAGPELREATREALRAGRPRGRAAGGSPNHRAGCPGSA